MNITTINTIEKKQQKKNIKRYTPDHRNQHMDEDLTGEWVKYDDVKEIIKNENNHN